jgi:hypothetical protein
MGITLHIMIVLKKKRSTLEHAVLWFKWLCCYCGIGNDLHSHYIEYIDWYKSKISGKLICFIEENKQSVCN